MKNTSEINWQKEALEFLLALSPVKRLKDIHLIRKNTIDLLRLHAHCVHSSLAVIEDDITARIVYSTDAAYNGFINAEHLQLLITDKQIAVTGDIGIKSSASIQFVVLPFAEQQYSGAVIIAYPADFIINDTCMEFLHAVWIGIKDINMLMQVYYSSEKLTTRFNAILSTIPESIVFVDDGGKEGWINESAATLLGIPAGNVPAIELSAAMFNLRTTAVNHDEITQRGKSLFGKEAQLLTNWKWVYGNPVIQVLDVSCVPAVSANIKGRLWVFSDVTFEHIAAEQLRELNAELKVKRKIADEQNIAKSDFLANMSHEIRTPMNGVIGMTSLLTNTPLTEEQKDYVETIRISGETLLSIINDILDFSKIESGKMELEQAPFNISKVIEETYDLLSVKAFEKGLDLLYYIDPGVPAEIIGDITRFRQVLVNLVSNGLKFTEKGEILIAATSLSKDGDMHTLEFQVKDTGIGIPADKYHRLFESFSQVDSSTTRKYGGTGLGLAICQRIVKLMGGTITVDSVENEGSCFRFTMVVQANKQAIQYNKKENFNTELFAGKSVLVIDDNLTNLRILKDHLTLWGLNVAAYDKYHDAIPELKTNNYDVAIIDMVMPEKNGLEVGAIIKDIRPALPMVLYSSAIHLSAKEKEQAQNIFNVILNKPFKREAVKDALHALLGSTPVQLTKATVPADRVIINTSNIRILVAEDDMINQKLISRVLEKLGYNYTMVDTGVKAVTQIKEQHFDIVFMDVMMPEMDGIEATGIIREVVEKNRQPVIIALTANALSGDREKLLGAGMDDFISKPYKSPDIQKAIEKWASKNDIS